MKRSASVFTGVCMVFLLAACGGVQHELTGKWQKTDNANVIIEFTASGEYYISFKGDRFHMTYTYTPDAAENNLQIGEDTMAIFGHVEFPDNDLIRINVSKPSQRVMEYRRVN